MTIHHPWDFITSKYRKLLFWIFLGLTIIIFAIFQRLDQPLRTVEAPSGIVSFELAGSVNKTKLMVGSWDQQALLYNAFGLGFDFLFMPVYATTLSLAVLLAAFRRSGTIRAIGFILGWIAYAAIIFDSVENICLFRLLSGSIIWSYPEIAAGCAEVKFGLIIVCMLFGFFGLFFPEKIN